MSAVSIKLPPVLGAFCGGQARLSVAGATVGEALLALQADYPAVAARVLDPEGRVRRHVNVFVGTRNIRDLEGLATPVASGEVLSIIPAVAGG